jgi:hypothetical protein
MAGTSPILTYGFGPWGGVELLPTLGFGIGEAINTTAVGRSTSARAGIVGRTSYSRTCDAGNATAWRTGIVGRATSVRLDQ